MVRTALFAAGIAALVAWSWARLEEPNPGLGELAAIAVLAVLPALVPRGRLRVATTIAAAAGAGWIALGVSPFDVRPFNGEDDYASPLLGGVRDGILDFYDVTVPFDGVAHPAMHGVLLLAVFAFSALAALAVAARRPVGAALVLLVGAGWPATIFRGDDELLRGAILLATVLALLAGLGASHRRLQTQVLAGTAVLLLALTLSASSALARGQFVAWENWDFYTEPDEAVSVAYVWRANYDGVRFPNKRTRVLRVRAPGRAGYWRATTLDAFAGHVWDEDLGLSSALNTRGRDVLQSDGLLPEAAFDEGNWTRADITVEALADNHLAGIAEPVAYDRGSLENVQYASGGVALTAGLLQRGDEYTVWGYAPRPKPAALARSPAQYPPMIEDDGRYVSFEGLALPTFGTPRRHERMNDLFDGGPFQAYAPVYAEARRIAGQARNPYAAAVALEAWFRTGGDFEYDESPPRRPRSAPPLVYFLTQSKAGYCQQFAGAMALMLRFLGVPSRVAAGFTSGTYDRGSKVWNVSDRNAHTWVEVWFRGFGWLPFDPTPGRGNLGGPYSASSFSFDAPGAQAVLAQAFGSARAADMLRAQLNQDSQTEEFTPRDVRRAVEEGEGGGRFGLAQVVLLALLALAALFAVGKVLLRRSRYLTRDPRRLASAYRRELVEFLADQRIDVPRSATLAELRALVQAETGVETRRLVESLGLARFGPLGAAPRAARVARAELRAAKRRLRRALSVGHRMRGTFSVRSLVVR
jgi:transglutaminase-like putative cysteine protease